MKINGILWLEDIVEKLFLKHKVDKNEVREIMKSQPLFLFVEKGHQKGENLYAAFGQTETGRYLAVYFIHKKNSEALILSARDMTQPERRKYEQR
ncbi:MAG: BrnT family toxin [Candidatus Aminicenantes bacterium]|jgi:uncharacterized DUF497 family protein|nr:BrnT family toxin [Candidatus Aminicenantes bacterium]